MPTSRRLCSQCGKVVEVGHSHAKADYKTTGERKFYNSGQWDRLRTEHKAKEPFCRQCRAEIGILNHKKIAVDHIVSIRNGGNRIDPNNLQSLCSACHNRKTGIERSRVSP